MHVQVEHREIFRKRIEPGVIAERSFPAALAWLHVAFQHDVRACRHFQIDRDPFHELDTAPAEKPGQQELVEPFGHRRRGGIRQDRLGTQRHRHLEPLAQALGHAMVLRSTFVALPVHAGRAPVEHLHSVGADVPDAGFRIFGDHQRESDVPSAVLGPCFQDRQLVQRAVALDHFLTRRVFHRLGHQVAQPIEHRQHLERIEHARRHLRRHHLVDVFRHAVERADTQRQAHALGRSEQVGRHGHIEPRGALEEQTGASAGQFAHAIGERRDFEVGIDALANAGEQAALVEVGDEVVEV